jgi:hypothetical protein
MKEQQVVVKIPRKQNKLIPFSIDLWNTGEYDAVFDGEVVTVLTVTRPDYSKPIVINTKKGDIYTFNNCGYGYSHDLSLRKKSTESELPCNRWVNVYSFGISSYTHLYKDEADKYAASNNRIALIYIVYEWED